MYSGSFGEVSTFISSCTSLGWISACGGGGGGASGRGGGLGPVSFRLGGAAGGGGGGLGGAAARTNFTSMGFSSMAALILWPAKSAAATSPSWKAVEPKTQPARRAAYFPLCRFVTSSNTRRSLVWKPRLGPDR